VDKNDNILKNIKLLKMLIREISFRLQVGTKILLNTTELAINTHSKYGLVGANGSGKTSLINYVSNNYSAVYVGQILENNDTSLLETVLSGNKRLLELRTCLKHAYSADDDDLITEALQKLTDEYDIDREMALVKKILKGLGFGDFEMNIKLLSGGQQVKINLAKALYMMSDNIVMKSHVLLLDEPTNHLDINNVLFLTKYLKEEFKGTLIMASHDHYLLDDICTNIISIHNTNLNYYKGNYSKYMLQLEEEIRVNNKNYDKIQNKIKEMRKKNTPKSQVDAYIKETSHAKKITNHGVTLRFYNKTRYEIMNKTPCIINVDGISFSYAEKQILNKVSFIINDPLTRIAIIGKNGSGKSTFLKIISGKLIPDSGTVETMPKINIYFVNILTTEVVKIFATLINIPPTT
jgi:ATP-binding cassette subfamily F protein 3